VRKISIALLVLLLGNTDLFGAEISDGENPYLTDTFYLDIGLFFPSRELKLSVDGSVAGARSAIDFDTAFGLKKSDDVLSVNGGWRFSENWQLGAQYFASDGQQSRVLEEDVEWGDYTFGAGTGVAAGLDFSLFRTFFARKFQAAEHHSFGVGIGIHWLEIGAFIEGNAIINDEQAGFRRESVSAKAPLPNIGVWYIRTLSDRWSLRARFDWLEADIDKYDGRLINASASVNYAFSNFVGIGASYNVFQLNVGVDENNWRGDVKTSYEGLFVHASLYW
jgi:hypothetical protein